MKQNAISNCSCGAIFLLTALLGGQTVFAQEMSLHAVYNAISGVKAPVWVAQEANLFTKHGVNVDLKYLAATTAVQAMVAGNEEIGMVGNQVVDAKLEGDQNADRSQRQSCSCDPTRGVH